MSLLLTILFKDNDDRSMNTTFVCKVFCIKKTRNTYLLGTIYQDLVVKIFGVGKCKNFFYVNIEQWSGLKLFLLIFLSSTRQ